jgi:hypothetical protein
VYISSNDRQIEIVDSNNSYLGAPVLLGSRSETYFKVRIGKLLSETFPIQNGLNKGDALSPLLFNSALEYAIKTVQQNKVDWN